MDCFGTYFTHVQSCNENPCSNCYGMDCFGTYFTHVQICNEYPCSKRYTEWPALVHTSHGQSCNVTRVQSATEWTRPGLRPSAPPTFIDVYRRCETSRDIDRFYRRRRRRRRPAICAHPRHVSMSIDVARHRETSVKSIDVVVVVVAAQLCAHSRRLLHVSMSIDVARHRETSIKSIDVVVGALVCAHPRRQYTTCIDVARHRETSIKFIDVARHPETSIKFIDVARHR